MGDFYSKLLFPLLFSGNYYGDKAVMEWEKVVIGEIPHSPTRENPVDWAQDKAVISVILKARLFELLNCTETGICARRAMVDQAREGLCYQKET